jgi:hypothetical protein
MGSTKSSDRPLALLSSIGPIRFFSLWRLVRLFSAGSSDRLRCDRGESGNEASILAIYPACPATVLGMTALKQLAFSLAFAITAVAAAQYIMWILNGQP